MASSYFLALVVLWSIPVFSKPPEIASSSSIRSDDKQIDHTRLLVAGISKQYLDKKFSDVVFVVNNEKLHAHRVIIASHSEYFSKVSDGGIDESGRSKLEIKVVTSSPTAFEMLLKYSYTGRINLGDLESKDIVELFRLSNYFGFLNLLHSLSEYFRRNFTIHNACSLFVESRLYGDGKQLYDDLLVFMDTNTLPVLQSEGFLCLSPEALQEILNRDTFVADELDIFKAVTRWIRKHQDLDSDTKTRVLSVVRYQLIGDQELLTVVSESQLISEETISDVINSKKTTPPNELECLRRVSKSKQEPNVNFLKTSVVDADISETNAVAIIDLGQPTIINYIKFQLQYLQYWHYTTEKGWYSYYIEVSFNRLRWERVLDYSGYICRSFQRLWFDPQTVQYIKIVGTRNADKMRKFEILEIMNNTKERHTVDIRNGFVAPKYNVALMSTEATVIEERGFSNNAMLTGKVQNYDRNYTCHRRNTGSIVVQLAQPYMLSSMRMYLWDENDADIRYTVEVSLNNVVWEKIADGTNERSRSCQTLLFEPRAVVFIRITGVYNSKGNDFYVALLEAPAQGNLASEQKNIDTAGTMPEA